jgi:hypothetical protein
MLADIEKIISKKSEHDIKDINDAIEAFNIFQFANNGLRLLRWDNEVYNDYHNFGKAYLRLVAKYFSTIEADNINEIFEGIETFYIEDFFVLFEKFELHRRIPWNSIECLLLNQKVHIFHMLKHEKIIHEYDTEIRNSLLSNPENAELFLNNLSLRNDEMSRGYRFPKSVSDADVERLFNLYIESENPNMNCLTNIVNYRSGGSNYKISKELQYKANKRLESLEHELFRTGGSVSEQSIEVSYKSQNEPMIYEANKLNIRLSFDRDWIINNLDYPTILNNFIHLFGYVDHFFQICLTNISNQSSALERALFPGINSDYNISFEFRIVNKLAEMEMFSYCDLLKTYSIELEKVLEWYYHTYLKEEYGINNFRISLLNNKYGYYEKCKSIAPEIESIAKQYESFVVRGCIDHEYIRATNPPVIYKKIPSVNIHKYAYPVSKDIIAIMELLFSDQSLLTYLPRKRQGDKNLYLLICNLKPEFDDFEECQKSKISFLAEKNILIIDSASGSVGIADFERICVLEMIYKYGYANILAYPVQYRTHIDDYINKGDLNFENSLLSKQEASYFNYYLNNSEFGNSKDLRNKYAHGSAGMQESEYQDDYYSLLKILVLLTIKIENDLQVCDTISSD